LTLFQSVIKIKLFACVVLIVGHKGFNIFWMVRYKVLANEATAVLCNQHVVLDTYSAKVLISFNFIEIKEIGGRVYVVATATVSDGTDELKVSAFAREPENKKGMDESQITGATSSYARKYALNGLYAIDDNKDADTNEHKQQQDNAPKKQQAQKQQQQQEKGFTEKELHELVEKYVRNIEALGVDRAKLIEFVCNKHSVGNLFDLKPNVLVGELKAIYLNKKGQAENKGGKTKTW